jgi:bacteriophage N4 adsorption protein B
MLWSNVINFAATCRAAWLFLTAKQRKGMNWGQDKSRIPELEKTVHTGALGEAAVARGMLTDAELNDALTERRPVERLGQTLLRLELISPDDLALLLAEQAGVQSESFDPREVTQEQRELLSKGIARKYGVFPLRHEPGGTLVVARETALLPVQLQGLQRRVDSPVRFVIVPQGTVTTALRMYCSDKPQEDPLALLEKAVESEQLSRSGADRVWEKYLHRQVLLGDILLGTHTIQSGALYQALLEFENSDLPLGQYLVQKGYLSEQALEEGLTVQSHFQPTMRQLLAEAGVDLSALQSEEQR